MTMEPLLSVSVGLDVAYPERERPISPQRKRSCAEVVTRGAQFDVNHSCGAGIQPQSQASISTSSSIH